MMTDEHTYVFREHIHAFHIHAHGHALTQNGHMIYISALSLTHSQKSDQGSRLFDLVVQYTDLVEKDYFGLAIRSYPFVADKKKKDKDRQGVASPEVTVDGQDFPPFVSGCHSNDLATV